MFIGGAGADTFILGGHDGAETITNFSDAKGDVINLANIGELQSLADVLPHATQVGSDTVIDFTNVTGLSTIVTLQNVRQKLFDCS